MERIKVLFYYPANEIAKPIIYHLIKDFDLEISILQADISLNKVGKLILDVKGEKGKIEAALKYVQEQEIQYKLFSKSIIWQENGCVHCGACTAVCPSNALQMDSKDWRLTFDREKCLVCGLCVRACPLKVMSLTE